MVDLLIICAESGMSIEHPFAKSAWRSAPKASNWLKELTLLAAEMSYLEQRRTAFENLNNRTGSSLSSN